MSLSQSCSVMRTVTFIASVSPMLTYQGVVLSRACTASRHAWHGGMWCPPLEDGAHRSRLDLCWWWLPSRRSGKTQSGIRRTAGQMPQWRTATCLTVRYFAVPASDHPGAGLRAGAGRHIGNEGENMSTIRNVAGRGLLWPTIACPKSVVPCCRPQSAASASWSLGPPS